MTSLFAYPQAAAFGRVVPKQRFYEHTDINPKVRELFVREVRRITWAYKLALETIGLSGSPSVPEIQVFTVDLKDLDLHDEVLGAIDRAVQFPIIFEVRRERAGMAEVRVVAAHKVLGARSPKVSAYFTGDWQGQDAVRAPLPPAVNLAGLYAQLLSPLLPASVRPGEDLSVTIDRMEVVRKVEREVAALEKRLRVEPQFNRKVELRRQIRDHTDELANLMSTTTPETEDATWRN
ncbi:MAG TPA: DUF4391 domain-containing protein [Dermatophilaceae bacterium]